MFYIWEMCLIFLLCTKHQTRERTRAHSYTQPPHTCKHAYTHAHLHTYTCAHYARTHARTHTHTHRTRKTDRQTHTHINNTNTTKTLKKGKDEFFYTAGSNPQDCPKRFTLYFPDSPVQSGTISTSLGSIQPYATIN